MNYGFVIDTKGCIGCHACSTACKSENQVPVGVHRTWVKYTEKGRYPDVARHFQVTRCNHCANPPCVRICPVTAMYQRNDGIVEFDPDVCIGCKACMQACPYDAIYIDPESHTAAKCHFCAHRIDVGQEPACVVVCPEHAIIAGDMDDPRSEISRVLARQAVTVRKPEQGTAPKVFYIEGNDVGLHPSAALAATTYMFSDLAHDDPTARSVPHGSSRSAYHGAELRQAQPQGEPSAGPVQFGGNMAGHMVQVGWNAQHHEQWHWPIPAYLVTKGTAGGLMTILGVAALAGLPVPIVVGGLLSLFLMLITTGLLLYDLDRPERFVFLILRPQWRSWVARAAWILSGFQVVLTGWLLLGGLGLPWLVTAPLAALVIPFGIATGTYTAFLFAQAEGRDFWQSSVTPLHMLLQTTYLGALGALMVGLDAPVLQTVAVVALAASALALLAELYVSRASDLAARAQRMLRRGKFAPSVWLGGLLLGHAVPLALAAIGGWWAWPPALLAAGLGMFLYERAYVTAPQQIPNS